MREGSWVWGEQAYQSDLALCEKETTVRGAPEVPHASNGAVVVALCGCERKKKYVSVWMGKVKGGTLEIQLNAHPVGL